MNKEEIAIIIGENIMVLVENSVLREADGKKYSITVSIGGAVLTEEDSIKSLIKRADENMYISKKSGKNMVTIG